MTSDSTPAFEIEKEALKTEIETGIQAGVDHLEAKTTKRKDADKYHNTRHLLKQYRKVAYAIQISEADMNVRMEMEHGTRLSTLEVNAELAGVDLSGSKLEGYARTVIRSKNMLQIIDNALNTVRMDPDHGELKLSAAIHKAKVSLPLGAGLDGEVSLNGKRQEIATLLRHMAGLRNGEVLISNGGVGYRFNNEGNQVSYRCDVKRVTTINFDRNKIRKMCADLSKKSDETSAALDAALVNTPVEYEAPFDVNETFAEAFEAHMSALC